jgi:hypothetical protein
MAALFNGGDKLLSKAYWEGTTLKVMLVSPSYVFNRDHATVSQITNELSGTGYVAGFGGAGRKTLTGKLVVTNDALNQTEFKADNPLWSAINAGTAKAAVIIQEVTSDADSIPLAYIDSATERATTGVDLPVQWPNGIVFVRTT